MGKIVITRENTFYSCLNTFSIYIDNKKVGTLPNGETKEFIIFNGKHQLYVGSAFDKSNILNFETSDSATVYIDCKMGLLNPKLRIREIVNSVAKMDDYEQLNRLKELKDKNIISEEEYKIEKNKILN